MATVYSVKSRVHLSNSHALKEEKNQSSNCIYLYMAAWNPLLHFEACGDTQHRGITHTRCPHGAHVPRHTSSLGFAHVLV